MIANTLCQTKWAVFLCVSLYLFSGSALACKCARDGLPLRRQIGKALQDSDATIFAGKVIHIRDVVGTSSCCPKERKEITLDVHSSWKGKVARGTIIETGREANSDCGYPFTIGQKYLVYASMQSSAHPSTSICHLTKPLAEAKEDLLILGTGQSVTGPPPTLPGEGAIPWQVMSIALICGLLIMWRMSKQVTLGKN